MLFVGSHVGGAPELLELFDERDEDDVEDEPVDEDAPVALVDDEPLEAPVPSGVHVSVREQSDV